jgi:hypothetical protein
MSTRPNLGSWKMSTYVGDFSTKICQSDLQSCIFLITNLN